jgi:hypothetical protein
MSDVPLLFVLYVWGCAGVRWLRLYAIHARLSFPMQ